jgi:hypothetical protein
VQPVATGCTHGAADHIFGIIGAIEPRGIRLGEDLERRDGGGRITGQQLVLLLVQPAVEHATGIFRLAMAVERGRAPPEGQHLLENGGELVRAVSRLHPREACLIGLVVLGEVEQHGDHGRRVLATEEGLMVFSGRFRHGLGQGLAVQFEGVPWWWRREPVRARASRRGTVGRHQLVVATPRLPLRVLGHHRGMRLQRAHGPKRTFECALALA